MMRFFKALQKSIVVITTMLLCACQSKISVQNNINFKEVVQGVGKEVIIKHTDSGKLKMIMRTPVLKDYTHIDFPYYEFPEGVSLVFFDKEGLESTVVSDYAINYEKTKLIDLQGNVKIITSDSTILKAPQLYWNQKQHWIYTDETFDILFKNGAFNKGIGFDANEDFSNFKSRINIGTQVIEE